MSAGTEISIRSNAVGGRDLVVRRAAGDVERIALLDADGPVLEGEVDPAAQHVDHLPLADVRVPAGGPRESGLGRGDLGADAPAARRREAEVAVAEEVAPPRHEGGVVPPHQGKRRLHLGRACRRRRPGLRHGACSSPPALLRQAGTRMVGSAGRPDKPAGRCARRVPHCALRRRASSSCAGVS